MSTLYDIKRVFIVVREMEQTASFAKTFDTRFKSLCQAAKVPILPNSWSGVNTHEELPQSAQQQLSELYNWLKKQFPRHADQFRV